MSGLLCLNKTKLKKTGGDLVMALRLELAKLCSGFLACEIGTNINKS